MFAVVSWHEARGDDDTRFRSVLEELGDSGADKVLCCSGDGDTGGLVEDATHGRMLLAAAHRIPPVLVLLPAGGVGTALGPTLAARMGAAFAPCADLLVAETPSRPDGRGIGRVQVVRLVDGGKQRRRLDPIDLERPVVATLAAGRTSHDRHDRDTPNVFLPDVLPFAPTAAISGGFPSALEVVEPARADDSASCELASVLVLWDDGPGAAALSALLRERAITDASVVVPAHTPPALLARACPEIVIRIGCSSELVQRAPRTRVVLALPPGQSAPEALLEEVDVLWEVQSERELGPEALAGLIAQLTAKEAP